MYERVLNMKKVATVCALAVVCAIGTAASNQASAQYGYGRPGSCYRGGSAVVTPYGNVYRARSYSTYDRAYANLYVSPVYRAYGVAPAPQLRVGYGLGYGYVPYGVVTPYRATTTLPRVRVGLGY